MKYLLIFLLTAAFALSCLFAIDTYGKVHDRKEKMEDYAEINMVNYELFNLQLWKEKTLDIVKKKIHEFEISETTYEVLDDQIQQYLDVMYQQYFVRGELGDIIIEEVKRSGNVNAFLVKMIESQVPDLLKEIDLKPQIPVFSDQIVQEIRKNEPLIRQYMQQELLRLVIDEETGIYRDRREVIYQKYGQADVSTTDQYLFEEVSRLDEVIKSLMLKLCLSMLGIIIIAVMLNKLIGFKAMVGSLTAGSIIFLILGVSLPMIDIDARMNSFRMNLFEEPIEFEEQIIYYQSKSIVEVTKTLWEGQGWDLKLVGTLVLLFSIVFPFFKLMLSGFYLFVEKVRESDLAKGIIFHLGKWSMADVFVVAIFMAYIGFYGIISSQLNGISQNQGGFAIETINYSRLSPGAFFFTAYTILSICISILISRHDQSRQKQA